MIDGPDAVFFNEVLHVAIRRFGNRLLTARTIDAMRSGIAVAEDAFRLAEPSDKPRSVPTPKEQVPPLPEAGGKP